MSFDVSLLADLGAGLVEVDDIDGWNYTYNCSAMWRAAGFDLRGCDGKPAGECLPSLRTAIAAMEDDPARFDAMNPPNGWGSRETSLPCLRRLAEAFARMPRAIVSVT